MILYTSTTSEGKPVSNIERKRYDRAKGETIFKQVDVPGAKITVYGDAFESRQTREIPVTNHDAWQLDVNNTADVELPVGLRFDVSPTVRAETSEYPYEPSRNSLKGPARDWVFRFISEIVAEQKAKRNAIYKEVNSHRIPIEGTGAYFLDTTRQLPKEFIATFIKSPYIKYITRVLYDAHLC